jgi:hypothetical protein
MMKQILVSSLDQKGGVKNNQIKSHPEQISGQFTDGDIDIVAMAIRISLE